MAGWLVTATTIHCEWVDEDVTIVVYKDNSAWCTGYNKFRESVNRETAKLIREKEKKLGRELKCIYPSACGLTRYRDKISSEESKQVKK